MFESSLCEVQQQKIYIISNRFKKVLETDEYKGVSAELAREYYDLFHKTVNIMYGGAHSWYDSSCKTHEHEDCDGDFFLNWKDKGSITIFSLLQVSIYVRKLNVFFNFIKFLNHSFYVHKTYGFCALEQNF